MTPPEAGAGGDGKIDAGAEVRALLVLRSLPDVGDRTVARLRERFGSGRAALAASRSAFAGVAGSRAANARGDRELRRDAERALRRASELEVRVTGPGLPGYPDALLHLHDPPPVLFLRGDPALLEPPAVAVVGSRRATSYGRRTAEMIGASLAEEGIPVVSGLALGIDAAAHRGALSVGGRAVGVLGAGVDVPHPPTNSGLFERVGREHLLVSEFLPGQPPLPHHFPQRNRILAALSRAVIVVEAAEKSGALITVDHAMDLGRDVLAVPGPVDRRTSRGTNALLRDGAAVVDDPRAVAEHFGWRPRAGTERRDAQDRSRAAAPPDGPGGEADAIWRALADGPRPAAALAHELELDPGGVLALLSSLEMEGWVEARPGMVYARRDRRGPARS